jgi:hypothetical protein
VWAEKSRKFHERIRGERVIPREASDKLGNDFRKRDLCSNEERGTSIVLKMWVDSGNVETVLASLTKIS